MILESPGLHFSYQPHPPDLLWNCLSSEIRNSVILFSVQHVAGPAHSSYLVTSEKAQAQRFSSFNLFLPPTALTSLCNALKHVAPPFFLFPQYLLRESAILIIVFFFFNLSFPCLLQSLHRWRRATQPILLPQQGLRRCLQCRPDLLISSRIILSINFKPFLPRTAFP